MRVLRYLATILSGPLLLIGVVWVLQGLDILPGSFMTGQIIWAVYGAPDGSGRRRVGLVGQSAAVITASCSGSATGR